MTIVLELELEGQLEALGTIWAVAHRAGNLEPALERVIDVWEDIEEKVFSDGVLVDTGRLMNSLTQRGADGAIRDIHDTEIRFGTDIEYARAAGAQTGHKVLAEPPSNSDEIVMDYLTHQHWGES